MTNNNYIKYKLLKPQKFSTSKLNTSNSKTFVSPNNKIHSNKIKPPTQNKLYNIINPLNHNNENDIDKIFELSALRITLFIGIFFGYMFVFYFTDNFGRKYSMVLAWSITVVGLAILSAALNIWMACVGLFLTGVGS